MYALSKHAAGSLFVQPCLCTVMVSADSILHGRVNLSVKEFFKALINTKLRCHRFGLRHQLPRLARPTSAFSVRVLRETYAYLDDILVPNYQLIDLTQLTNSKL